MIAAQGFHFGSPWWLLAGVLTVPVVWMALRGLKALGPARRWTAIVLRVLVVAVLVLLLARPTLTKTAEEMTLIAVIDRSRSIQPSLRKRALAYLSAALAEKPAGDVLAVVDAAEEAYIARLPSREGKIPERSTTLAGTLTRLSAGVELGMAIAPPDKAARLLLVSDGCETAGDLREAARIAAANGIPIDVLPLRYRYEWEVAFRRLVVPPRARSEQTIPIRCVLQSTHAARGKILLTLNGRELATIPVRLKPGTNVSAVSAPVGVRGVHEYEAVFVPDDARQDQLPQNNRAAGVTFVAGAGHILVVGGGASGGALAGALGRAKLDARAIGAEAFPAQLAGLLGADAVVLNNVDGSRFTFQQQHLLMRYVTELGGGLVMVGGPDSFGAGGWIGSPVAKVLPVDLDPPQKKVMPSGALVLVMHACEMPRGNYWGKRVAEAAVKTLSRLDLVGVIDYQWDGRSTANWVYPLGLVGDKKKVVAAIRQMVMGDMPDFGAPLQAAYNGLSKAAAGQKHVIVISDGDPSPPSAALLKKFRAAGITCSGVVVFPHSPQDTKTLKTVANYTGGKFYHVKNPNLLPQIFVKEAKIVRRSLIFEETFSPRLADASSEIVRGLLGGVPPLDGYVRTGRRGGLTQVVLNSHKGDPVLATGQFGLGRCVAFTSSADARWAKGWLTWGGFDRFWEQVIRWVAKSPQSPDCEVYSAVQGRDVTLTVEATASGGKPVEFARIVGQVIQEDEKMTVHPIALSQVGPGEYRAAFRAEHPGTYLVNLRVQKTGSKAVSSVQAVVSVPFAPEYEDLTDNAALLHEVAAATGGRVLPADPGQAELFSRAGVDPPRSAWTLTQPLMLAWVVLFLLDVAVRRIAVDVRAVGRRVASWLGRLRPRRKKDRTVEQLRARHKKLRKTLYSQEDRAAAGRRYVAGDDAAATLPDAPSAEPAEKPAREAPQEQEPPAAERLPKDHVQRLLQRKRRMRGGGDEKN